MRRGSSGTPPGTLSAAVKDAVGFDTTVILPSTHDTGSAFMAVPARDDLAAFRAALPKA